VVLALLIGWVAVLSQVTAERREAEMSAITRSQDRATLLEEHVVKTLQVAQLASLNLGQTYLSRRSARSAGSPKVADLSDPAAQIAGVAGAIVIDARGQIVARSAHAVLPGSWRPSDMAKYRVPDGAPLEISHPETGHGSKRKYVFVSKAISEKGRIVGRVILSFEPQQFLNFPLRTRFNQTDLVSVIKLDGITLARREGDKFSSGENVRSRLVMRQQYKHPNGTYLGPSSLDGVIRYFSHRRLADFPIFVTAGISHSAALASAHRRARGYFAVMGSLSALGLFMAWAVQREITYRRRQAVELAESTRRLREAQRIGKIGDWEYDLESGLVLWSNELCEMYERSPSDDVLSLDDFAAYLAPEGRERFQRDVNLLLTQGGEHTLEFMVVLPSGAISYRRSNAVASSDESGKITRLYGTDQDISDAQAFRELEKQLAHLDRQGAMSMMAGTLAHELNQPLTAASFYITGSLRAARMEGSMAIAAVITGMTEAFDQVRNAAEIIRRVRKMVQPESESSNAASVDDATREALTLLIATGLTAAESIEIELEPELPHVAITPVQLQQVLINLLKNALEAISTEGGKVWLNAQKADLDIVRIEVRDNGPGFETGSVDIFSPFTSGKETGLGLGLSISRTIVEYHGGRLFVENSHPGATLLVVELPIAGSEKERKDHKVDIGRPLG
jgi:two-component system sensor kinase FixL